MPSDKDKNWTPEPHIAHTYSDKEVAAGNKALKDFHRARSLSQPEQARFDNDRPSRVHMIMSWDLRPSGMGQTRIKPVSEKEYNDLIDALIQDNKGRSKRDTNREWQPKDLSKTFDLER